MSPLSIIQVSHLQKSFDSLKVLKDISFNVEKNDVVAVIGPSGSGKSTMLRCLVHLEEADGGSIRINGDYLVQDGQYPPLKKIREITAKKIGRASCRERRHVKT